MITANVDGSSADYIVSNPQRKTVRSFLPPNKAHLVKEQETKQKEKTPSGSHLPVVGARLSLGSTVETFEVLALFLWTCIPSLEGEGVSMATSREGA